ncbi:hypothetical protein PQQ86_25695 [Paraburkholderia sediminicola]|uniref:Uncharacterized protein n=1 Tax=Paraburkholderia metrosideri TaxID=580937 RepID=A0ABW9DVK1_9BURK
MFVFDTLGFLADPNGAGVNSGDGRTFPSVPKRAIDHARASGLTAVHTTLGYVFGDLGPYVMTLREVEQWDAIVKANDADIVKVFSSGDILCAKKANKNGLIYGFQNSDMGWRGHRYGRVSTTIDNLGAFKAGIWKRVEERRQKGVPREGKVRIFAICCRPDRTGPVQGSRGPDREDIRSELYPLCARGLGQLTAKVLFVAAI